MNQQRQKIALLCNNRKYNEAKDLLCQLINNDNNGNKDSKSKMYRKLGRICIKQNKFNESLLYFRMSHDLNKNVTACIDIGNVYQYHLNDYSKAIENYNKAIEISPNNQETFFQLATLFLKMGRFEKAEQCFAKLEKNKACVFYEYGLFLWNKPHPNKEEAVDCFFQAMQMKSDSVLYTHQYALCMQELKIFSGADDFFKKSLELSNHQCADIYFDYGMFLMQCKQNLSEAKHCLIKVLHLAKSNASLISKCYKNLHIIYELEQQNQVQPISPPIPSQQPIQHQIHQPSSKLKLIVYDWAKTLAYSEIDQDLEKLKMMRTGCILRDFLGGTSRLKRLRLHFRRMLSIGNSIKFVILSTTTRNVKIIENVLDRFGMRKFFSQITISTPQNVLQDMQAFKNKYNILDVQTLFISSKKEILNTCKKTCMTFEIKSSKLNGLSLAHFKEIETEFGTYDGCDFDIDKPSNGIYYDLQSKENATLIAIERQVGKLQPPERLEDLHVIQHVKAITNEHIRENLLYYAYLYKHIRSHEQKNHHWMDAQILQEMMKIRPKAMYISQRYAKCLSYLGHMDEAKALFEELLTRYDTAQLHKEYGLFNLKLSNPCEAAKHFEIAIGKDGKKVHSGTLIGYAEALDMMQRPHKAKEYFELAIQNIQPGYETNFHANLQYGKFLYKQEKYQDAKVQFNSAVQQLHEKKYPEAYYYLAMTQYHLRSFKEFKENMEVVLQMDPFNEKAKIELERHKYSLYGDI